MALSQRLGEYCFHSIIARNITLLERSVHRVGMQLPGEVAIQGAGTLRGEGYHFIVPLK